MAKSNYRLAAACLLLLCSCARRDFTRAPEPFRPLPKEAKLEERKAALASHQVTVLGSDLALVNNQRYNAVELLRYYDDSRHSDASALETKAIAKLERGEEWAFYGGAYASLAGILIGGINAYLNTSNSDFAALNSALSGALVGWAYGAGCGIVIGATALSFERRAAKNLQIEAAGEFNTTAARMLGLSVEMKY